jgi:hypothetical protein
MASLPASESKGFREEFDTVGFMTGSGLIVVTKSRHQEYEDVQLTAFLSTLTKSANVLNNVASLLFFVMIWGILETQIYFNSLSTSTMCSLHLIRGTSVCLVDQDVVWALEAGRMRRQTGPRLIGCTHRWGFLRVEV